MSGPAHTDKSIWQPAPERIILRRKRSIRIDRQSSSNIAHGYPRTDPLSTAMPRAKTALDLRVAKPAQTLLQRDMRQARKENELRKRASTRPARHSSARRVTGSPKSHMEPEKGQRNFRSGPRASRPTQAEVKCKRDARGGCAS